MMQATTTTPLPLVPTTWRRWFPASAAAVGRNYVSAAGLLLIVYGVYAALYRFVPYYHHIIEPAGFTGLTFVLLGYLAALPIFYATFPDDATVKCRRFWHAVFALRRRPLTDAEKTALRAVAVKAFFLPLMISWSIYHFGNLINAWHTLTTSGFAFRHLYSVLFLFILVGDVGCYTIGYAVEHPRLNNEIRSVEPTISGWLVALACYPPLHLITARLFGWYAADYPEFQSPFLQVVFGIIMLALIAIYSWASIALGFKASNLTNRGIVSTGPYAFVRHPAYIGKNLFWLLSAIPIVWHRGSQDARVFLAAAFGLSCWCGLYVLRALTEERHLRRDPDYVAYCEKVKWRFVPGVF
jgi:protein-S-isoprenylcysteine O-methyltransferase Ste14